MMSDRQNLSVALLEHNPVQAAKISNCIESDGSYCRSYTSVTEFHLDFRKSTYDLVLLDWISLNDSSGQVILRWIRRKPGSNIPIILLADRQSKKKKIVTALNAGADECLFKPVQFDYQGDNTGDGRDCYIIRNQIIVSRGADQFDIQNDSVLPGSEGSEDVQNRVEDSSIVFRYFELITAPEGGNELSPRSTQFPASDLALDDLRACD